MFERHTAWYGASKQKQVLFGWSSSRNTQREIKYPQKTGRKYTSLPLSLSLSLSVWVLFNCQQLIPCRNGAKSFALILRGAPRQLPFTADERVCRRQLHYLFIIYDSISSDNGGRSAPADSPTDGSSLPFYKRALLYLFDGIWVNRKKSGFLSQKNEALTYWNII